MFSASGLIKIVINILFRASMKFQGKSGYIFRTEMRGNAPGNMLKDPVLRIFYGNSPIIQRRKGFQQVEYSLTIISLSIIHNILKVHDILYISCKIYLFWIIINIFFKANQKLVFFSTDLDKIPGKRVPLPRTTLKLLTFEINLRHILKEYKILHTTGIF